MSTVNVSVPDDVNEAFDAAFKGQNKSAIVKQPMREAVERAQGILFGCTAMKRISPAPFMPGSASGSM